MQTVKGDILYTLKVRICYTCIGHSTMTSLSLDHNMHAWNYCQYITGLPFIN